MSSVQSTSRCEAIASGNGSSVIPLADGVDYRPLVSGDLRAQGLSTGIATFNPNAKLPVHIHSVSKAIVPLSGKIHVIVEGRRYLLGRYDAMHVPADVMHWVQNDVGESPISCLVTFASETPSRDWVEETSAIEDTAETDSSCAEHLTRFAAAPVYELSHEAQFRDLFAGRFGTRGICGGYGIFQPEAALPCHVHSFDESITIVEGRAVCQVAGREYEVSNCDTVCVPEGRPHRFINRSDRPMAMIWVYAGDEPDRTVLDRCCCEESQSANQAFGDDTPSKSR
jgi:quercetin dioxygenase-like cupin family protein